MQATRFNRKFVFIAGLHRSGTTLLADLLGAHPDISAFRNTGAYMDEGQHLQSVYPVGHVWGGDAVGRFGFDPFAHLTEKSPLARPEKADALFAQWARYWDLSKPVLLEKSPPNIIRTRYLQACFPESYFVVITRHPVANAVATKKWCGRNPLIGIMANWAVCHVRFLRDQARLKNAMVIKYEDLVAEPARILRAVTDFIGLAPLAPADHDLRRDVNEKYFARWREASAGPLGRAAAAAGRLFLEGSFRRFGYSFDEARG
ncbi:sulfotransferase family protein [Amphiplicatus metriothermophilus]|uniref:Sulfotransferase family protein n=1 Tax=Amphiplicatus metriothermophilus TaxID=1519374 RepID=A0A239PT53_9PROT|nr:sulfotransferase [Amphiplicatus metriothermophilus]MBB5519352.1 hypothetical protein [Amphiplicatus metriothermophilus]SNT73455.1 Sulfotransferase family protein [Amphiplicatus metriothermophilus]